MILFNKYLVEEADDQAMEVADEIIDKEVLDYNDIIDSEDNDFLEDTEDVYINKNEMNLN